MKWQSERAEMEVVALERAKWTAGDCLLVLASSACSSTSKRPSNFYPLLHTVALPNKEPLESITLGGDPQYRSAISRRFSHKVLTCVVQYLARLW
jgi:hypothetical protein